MTREDIIRMAREAGLLGKPTYINGLEAFAALVASAEREACAKEAETTFYSVQAAENIRARG